MRAFISINQMAFSQIADSRKIKLDLIDATIFEYIYKFAVSNKAIKQIINDKLYIWCSYKKIIDDNPLINISSKRAIENRLNKLVEIGLLSKFTDKKKGNKTFFNVTDLAYTLVIENTNLSHRDDIALSHRDDIALSHRDDYNSKLNNRELDNTKEDNNTYIKSDAYFEKLWAEYGRVGSKSLSKRKYLSKSFTYSEKEISLAISRYLPTVKDKKFQKHFSTFLNSISDYLEDYEETSNNSQYYDPVSVPDMDMSYDPVSVEMEL